MGNFEIEFIIMHIDFNNDYTLVINLTYLLYNSIPYIWLISIIYIV